MHDRFAAFHAAHFGDPSRRAWFASQLDPTRHMTATREELEDAWTTPAYGESDAQWQARHGLQHLTPGAARLFDHSRRFRAQRSASPSGTHPAAEAPPDLASLRTRALAALHKKKAPSQH